MSVPVLKTGTNNNLHSSSDNLGNFVMLLLVFKELFSKAFMIAFIYTVHNNYKIVGSNTAIKGLKYCIYNKEDIVMDAYKDYNSLMANIALLNIEEQVYDPEELLNIGKHDKINLLDGAREENSIELHPYTDSMVQNIRDCYLSIYEEAQKLIETRKTSPANAAIVAFNEFIIAELNMTVFSDVGSESSTEQDNFEETEQESGKADDGADDGAEGEKEGGTENEKEGGTEGGEECTSESKCPLCLKIDESVEKWNDWNIDETEEEDFKYFFTELKKLVSLMEEFTANRDH